MMKTFEYEAEFNMVSVRNRLRHNLFLNCDSRSVFIKLTL
jgi:hypothetical protein